MVNDAVVSHNSVNELYYLEEVDSTNYINMCRTQVRIKMNAPAEYFLRPG